MKRTVIDKNEQGKDASAIHQTNGNGRLDHEQSTLHEEAPPTAEPEPEIGKSEEEIEAPARNGKRRRLFIIGGVAALVLAIVGTMYWLYARQYESTDDAFVEADITQVAPKVAAYVKKVHVSNNQYVHKGDVLIDLDASELQVRVQQAKAQLEQAKSQR